MLRSAAAIRKMSPPASVPDALLLVAEIEHRVANEYASALATISLAASRSDSLEVKAALDGTARRLRDYASVHRSLQSPMSGGMIDLSAYLRDLCAAISRARLNERGISLRLVEQRVDLASERCWRVGLIVSELITNSMRHGVKDWSGAITVELSCSAGQVLCRVDDNGKSAADIHPGRGTRLVDALAGELGGGVERSFTPFGATVRLAFPQQIEACR